MNAACSTRVFVQAPRASLRGFVRRFLVVEATASRRDLHLPDTGFVAAFALSGVCLLGDGSRVPNAAITGLWDSARIHDHARGHAVALIAFTPTGASALLREPLGEFANTTTDLAQLLGREAGLELLGERLSEAPNHDRRADILEQFLLSQLRDSTDPLATAAVDLLETSATPLRIDELARRIGLSQSALERRFFRSVGTTPRRYASLVRLRKVLQLRASGLSLTEVAHAAGYSDQAHFIHDFRQFAGQPPGAYFSRAAA